MVETARRPPDTGPVRRAPGSVGRMRSVRWASLATVVGCVLLALVCLVAVLRGRAWAWAPGLVSAAIAFREVRALRRDSH